MNISLIKSFKIWMTMIFIILSLPTNAQTPPSAFNYAKKNISTPQLLTSSAIKIPSVSSWPIKINQKMTELASGNDFSVTLPSGDLVTASVKSHKKFDNGDVQIQASYGKEGNVILTMGKQVTFGSITSPIHNYSVSIDESRNPILVDNQTLPAGSTDLSDDIRIPDALNTPIKQSSVISQEMTRLQAAAVSSGKTNIDILFVYSSEFKALFSEPETRINQLIAFSNMSFDSSGILINLRMAGVAEIAFANGDSNSNLLNAVTNSTGVFSVVPQMRDDTGADLVAVLGEAPRNSASGIAFILGGRNRDRWGFSFTRLSNRCCDTVFTHEIGHNLGSGHERPTVNPDANISRCTGGFTGFSCGHGNTTTNDWGTIMSNISSRAIIGFRFSNLDNTCVGEPCGIAEGLTESADNRTSLNMTRLIVAEFRDEPVYIIEREPGASDFLPAIYDLLFN